MYKIERYAPTNKFVSDFIKCSEHEGCEDCACASGDERFICALLSLYRDTIIQVLYEIS